MTFLVPRYIAPFCPKRVPHHFADVLVIGGGIAGLRAALAVDPRFSVLVVTKDVLEESSSHYAQGGIAGVLDPKDCFEQHVTDTLVAGAGLCDRSVVEMVVREAPDRIDELVGWGTQFDRENGTLSLGREAGHGHRRIAHALGDATGLEIMRAMIEEARSRRNVMLWQRTFSIDLLTNDGACRGALIWNDRHGKTLVWAKQTILCAGGIGQIYRETTNPKVATADGHAMAYRAGADLLDMEFMQFHPTVLYIAGSSRSLITEAMRGEGGRLIDCNGCRFMPEYDPRAELAPRDVVSRAIVAQMEKTRHPSVYLDMTHLDPALIRKRFPGISRICAEFGIDITRDKIPVRPGAHYAIGGMRVDQTGQTSLPQLWAAGEVTSSGLHGANRLASNSLLEGMVFGMRAGLGASAAAGHQNDTFQALPLINPEKEPRGKPLDLTDIRNSLKSLTWRAAGVRRDADHLRAAAASVQRWCHYVLPRQFSVPAGWELQNMLIVTRLIVAAALAREETRGVHVRTDFPEANPELSRRRTGIRRPADPDASGPELFRCSLPELPEGSG